MTALYHHALRTHQWIYQHTNGALGHRLLFGNPTLLLDTIGRRTGLPRTSALTYPRDGNACLIVASKPNDRLLSSNYAPRPLRPDRPRPRSAGRSRSSA
jgi:hypothetical protein